MPKFLAIHNLAGDDTIQRIVRPRITAWFRDVGSVQGWGSSELLLNNTYSIVDPAVGIKYSTGLEVEQIEIIAHGSPQQIGDLAIRQAESLGRSLKTQLHFDEDVEIYLNGCNTGLPCRDGCAPIAQYISNGASCSVYGTLGYLIASGSHAEELSSTLAEAAGYNLYPGGMNAIGAAAWRMFRPLGNPPVPADCGHCVNLGWAGAPPTEQQVLANSADILNLLGDILSTVDEIVVTGPPIWHVYLTAPDFKFSVIGNLPSLEDPKQILLNLERYEVHGNWGLLLRSPDHRLGWGISPENATKLQDLLNALRKLLYPNV